MHQGRSSIASTCYHAVKTKWYIYLNHNYHHLRRHHIIIGSSCCCSGSGTAIGITHGWIANCPWKNTWAQLLKIVREVNGLQLTIPHVCKFNKHVDFIKRHASIFSKMTCDHFSHSMHTPKLFIGMRVNDKFPRIPPKMIASYDHDRYHPWYQLSYLYLKLNRNKRSQFIAFSFHAEYRHFPVNLSIYISWTYHFPW